jgi:hypothetical protein
MFEAALKTVVGKLNKARQEGVLLGFGLIGGVAVARWGYARATADIDIVIRINNEMRLALAEALNAKLTIGDIRDPLLATIAFDETVDDMAIPVQLIQLPKSWEDTAFVDLHDCEFAGCTLPVVDWAALVLLKLYAGSALDIEDARRVIHATKPTPNDIAALTRRATYLRVDKKLKKLLICML